MRTARAWGTPPRLEPAERPHAFGGSPEEVARSLEKLSLANRYFAGTRSLLDPLRRLIAPHRPGPIRLVDVGCGGAEQARAILDWARRRGVPMQVVAVDRDPDVVRRAAEALRGYPEARVVQGDARRLPFSARGFDYVVSSMLLHYFSWEEAGLLLRAWARLASGALLVNDVERHWFPCAAIRFLARLSGSTLFDESSGLTVLRGFTPQEFRRLAAGAGFGPVTVRRYFPFRLTVIIRTARSGPEVGAGGRGD